MIPFVSDAYAQAGGQQSDPIMSFLPLIFLIIVFYFLLIRPQQKRQKEHKQMTEALSKGDEAVTRGGIAGKITKVGENFLEMEVAENTVIKVQRAAIENVLPKGTLKNL